jgi:hypothetical protein
MANQGYVMFLTIRLTWTFNTYLEAHGENPCNACAWGKQRSNNSPPPPAEYYVIGDSLIFLCTV